MLHPAANSVDHSVIEGHGFKAGALIRSGEVVWRRDPDEPVHTLEEVEGWSPEDQADFARFGFQCDEQLFIHCKGIDRYTNHSCDPNTWWSSSDGLAQVACRDIQPGEEITYDYATSDIRVSWRMVCHCGAATCRGTITNLDYLDPVWQRHYGERLPRHVLQAIHDAVAQREAAVGHA